MGADGWGLGALGAGLCFAVSAVSVPEPTLSTPAVEEGAEDARAVGGWDVVATPASGVPLVVLWCGL